jgi:cobalt/nickel transport system permease protein
MHIAEGVLSAPVLIGGGVLAAAGVGIGLRKLDYERVPRVAVLSAAFFVASLIHLPVGGSSVHLVLNGLIGVLLGWAAFPALLIALTLQAVLFGYGGLSVLGVNTVVMGAPALACYLLFNRRLRSASGRAVFALGFAAGATGILGGCALLAATLVTTGEAFTKVAGLTIVMHLPVAAIEGLVTGSLARFLRQVKPELLDSPIGAADEREKEDD